MFMLDRLATGAPAESVRTVGGQGGVIAGQVTAPDLRKVQAVVNSNFGGHVERETKGYMPIFRGERPIYVGLFSHPARGGTVKSLRAVRGPSHPYRT